MCCVCFFCARRRRHTRCALVTGVRTCALPIFYKFSLREIPGAFLRAWNREKVRLERVGKGVWSLDNEIIPPLMITLAVYTALVLARSEARRVGHACVSTCISRGSSHIE